ncbi:hypothetical protein HN937_16580, partial [Candidatus Poribacteria bacterium]|nr:hypothetical protein [Candidatus Poribacteria bacterium]
MFGRASAILTILASCVVAPAWSQIAFVTNEHGNLDIAVASDDGEIWSEVVYGGDEAGGVSLVDLNTTNPERMDTPCTRI